MKVHLSEVNLNFFDMWYMYYFYTNNVWAVIMILFNIFDLSHSLFHWINTYRHIEINTKIGVNKEMYLFLF